MFVMEMKLELHRSKPSEFQCALYIYLKRINIIELLFFYYWNEQFHVYSHFASNLLEENACLKKKNVNFEFVWNEQQAFLAFPFSRFDGIQVIVYTFRDHIASVFLYCTEYSSPTRAQLTRFEFPAFI